MIKGIGSGVGGLEEALAQAAKNQKARGTEGVPSADFGSTLTSAVQAVENQQAEADQSVYRVASGQDADLAGMMIALEEANIGLRAMASVRDKVVEAYQQIWNMPI
ncbi:MAG: flagellar hook-basal body complex protein FliE [Deltaproteobacteria bacterium]|nr:flagellar hook-basal body complex protein FliE [Deltaproteobacteria bacterium]